MKILRGNNKRMPSDDDDYPMEFPLHNKEPEFIDYFASLRGQKINLSDWSCREAQKSIFESFPETDVMCFVLENEELTPQIIAKVSKITSEMQYDDILKLFY